MLNRMTPSWWWRVKMGKAYVARDYSSAIDYARRCLNSNTQDVSALWTIADCYRLQKNYDKAIEYAQKAFASEPQDIDTLRLLAELYFEREDYRSAYDYVRKALAATEEFDARFGETLDTVTRSFSSVAVTPRLQATHKAVVDEHTRAKGWIEWAVKFKAWYEATGHPDQTQKTH